MNSATISPDRGSTLVLIDDVAPSTSPTMGPTNGQSSSSISTNSAGFRPHTSSTHPPDPLLYGLQNMEWRPWLRTAPGSSSSVDEYAKSPATANAHDDFPNNYRSKVNLRNEDEDTCTLDLHGIRSCRRSLRWWAKLFWTLLLLAATGGLGYELYRTVEEYWWNHSVSGSYVIASNPPGGSIPFPDIYVCPTNPVNETYRLRRRTDMRWFRILSALQQKSNPDGILGKLFASWDYPSSVTNQISNSLNNRPSQQVAIDSSNPNLSLDELQQSFDPSPKPFDIDGMRDFFFRYGYDTDGFLVECSFRSKSFKCVDVAQPILDRRHGKCFLFPFGSGLNSWPPTLSTMLPIGNVNASWRVSNGGHGLSLAMNIHTELHPSQNGSLYDGVYLYVDWHHDPASIATKKPVLLPPGAYSSVSLEAREIRSRPSSSMHCYDDDADAGGHKQRHRWMVLNNPRYYRQDLCKFDCLLQSIIDSCRCLLLIDGRYLNRSAFYYIERRANNDSDPFSTPSSSWTQIGYCTNEQLQECVFDILQQYDSSNINEINTNNCTNQCRPSCNRKEYVVVSNSYLKLPAENYLGSGPGYPYPWNELKANYVIVDIVLEQGQTTIIEENSSINLEAFLGTVGGLMSLFVGCSVLTIVQIAVIILSCFVSLCQRIYNGKCLTVRKTLRKMRHSSLLK